MSIKNAKIISTGTDSDEYHEQKHPRGSPEFIMSASGLDNFDQCASRWLAGYEIPASAALDDGSLFDVRLLTPQQFERRYAVKPETYVNKDGEEKPWNANATVAKEWLAKHKDVEMVSATDVSECDAAIKRFRSDELLAAFLDASAKQVHVTGQWHDKETGLVIPLRALLDLVPNPGSDFRMCIGDVKRTRSAAPGPWAKWCFTASYHFRAAFYLDILRAAEGVERTDFCFLLSESYPPWETGRRILSQEFIELGRMKYVTALRRYCACLKSKQWDGYEPGGVMLNGWQLCEPQSWMVNAETAKSFPQIEPPEKQTDSNDIIP